MFSGKDFDEMAISKIHFNFIYSKNRRELRRFCPIESVSEEDFHRHFNTNVLSVYLTTQAAVRQFGDGGGNIINIATAGIEACAPMTSL